ncbi:MAG TPA: glycosyl transferase, partial [Chryseosolibacter sp.]
LLVIPMKRQQEQHYNAAALKQLGVPVIKKLKKKHFDKITEWIETDQRIPVDYPDTTAEAVQTALDLGKKR